MISTLRRLGGCARDESGCRILEVHGAASPARSGSASISIRRGRCAPTVPRKRSDWVSAVADESPQYPLASGSRETLGSTSCTAYHQRRQFFARAWPTGTASFNEGPLASHEFPVPAKQCLGRDDRPKLAQRLAPQRPRLLGKLPSLGVSEDDAPSANSSIRIAAELGRQLRGFLT